MKRKIIQDYANTLCQMLVGWRMGDDISKFNSLESGKFTIDILNKKCLNNGNTVKGLHIVEELNAWFLDQLQNNSIPLSNIEQSVINADIEIEKTEEKKKALKTSLKWDIKCTIQTEEKVYEGRLKEIHTWAGAI
jgi:hypothetical protein